MAYVSLYRKWRPQTFADVIGQTHVVRTLSNALNEKRIAHAYLFTGPRGTGKTTIARLLAKGLNCADGPTAEPCGECPSCQRIAEGMAMDVVEIDGASNRGIDEMRDVRERVRFAPTEGSHKIYIIDEVHMLTNEAFNALLKVLEEPPAHVVFVFATTEPHKIPATVASRCQRFDFRRLSATDTITRLKAVAAAEGINVTDDAFTLIARYAEGSLRDGLGILDQARAYEDKVTAAIVADVLGVAPLAQVQRFADVLAERDAAQGLALVKELQETGRELRQFLKDAARYLRDVLLLGAAGEAKAVDELGPEDEQTLRRHAEQLPPDLLLHAIEVLGAAEGDMRWAAQSGLPVEMAIIRLTSGTAPPLEASGTASDVQSPATPPSDIAPSDASPARGADTATLLRRIERLEAMVARLTDGDSRATVSSHNVQVDPGVTSAPEPSFTERIATERRSSETTMTEAGVKSGGGVAEPSASPGGAVESVDAADPSGAQPNVNTVDANLDAVLAHWDKLYTTLRERRHLEVLAFLREGKPVQLRGGVLTIAFPVDRGFHRASLESDVNRRVVEGILTQLLRFDVKVKTVLADDAGTTALDSTEATAPDSAEATTPDSTEATTLDGDTGASVGLDDPSEHPVIKEALRVFGGKIVSTKRPSDERQ